MKSKNCWTIEEAESVLLPGERMDRIGFGGLTLIQEPSSFCYGIDAVLLADFASRYVKPAHRVCDLGTGTGVIPLILSRKTQASQLVGVEVQLDSAKRAARNAARNQLSHRIQIVWEDAARIGLKGGDRYSAKPASNAQTAVNAQMPSNAKPASSAKPILNVSAGLQPSSFDVVVCNPPYMRRGSGLLNWADAKTVARHETTAQLEDFIRSAAYLLKDRGSLCMIHRPNRLVDLFVLCREYGLEPKELQLICPRAGSEPNLALVRCGKGGNPDLKVLDSLWVYDSQGKRSQQVERMYGINPAPDGG